MSLSYKEMRAMPLGELALLAIQDYQPKVMECVVARIPEEISGGMDYMTKLTEEERRALKRVCKILEHQPPVIKLVEAA